MTFTGIRFTSNIMNLLVKRNNLSKVSAELCKHMKHQKWKNTLVGQRGTATSKYNLKSEYTLLGCDKYLPSASHLHRTGEFPQGCESVNLLSLNYICEYFPLLLVISTNKHFMEDSYIHDTSFCKTLFCCILQEKR